MFQLNQADKSIGTYIIYLFISFLLISEDYYFLIKSVLFITYNQ